MNILKRRCDKCQISGDCEKKGFSPLIHEGSQYLCRIINGYSMKPINRNLLSDTSKALYDSGRTCLTIIETPEMINGEVVFLPHRIFHNPISHHRATSEINISSFILKNSK